MAEYFKELYSCEDLELTSSYIVREHGRPMGIAMNLGTDDEYASGGQLCLTRQEVSILYPVIKQFVEELSQTQKEANPSCTTDEELYAKTYKEKS